jgi:uncharacterized protein (DUF2147 family)
MRLRLGVLAVAFSCLAATSGRVTVLPPIAGDWLTEGADGVIQIGPCPQGLCGRIVGIARGPTEPMPVDVHGRPQCGLTILTINPEPEGGVWHGQVTDPRNGKVYNAELRINPRGRLLMRGYIGIPLLGQTQVWQRFIGRFSGECRFIQGNGPQGAQTDATH